MVTAEFRHKTLTPTFLATPRRGRVLFAKLAVGVLIGVVLGVIGILGAVAASAAFLAGFGLETGITSADTWTMFGRMLLASAVTSRRAGPAAAATSQSARPIPMRLPRSTRII